MTKDIGVINMHPLLLIIIIILDVKKEELEEEETLILSTQITFVRRASYYLLGKIVLYGPISVLYKLKLSSFLSVCFFFFCSWKILTKSKKREGVVVEVANKTINHNSLPMVIKIHGFCFQVLWLSVRPGCLCNL